MQPNYYFQHRGNGYGPFVTVKEMHQHKRWSSTNYTLFGIIETENKELQNIKLFVPPQTLSNDHISPIYENSECSRWDKETRDRISKELKEQQTVPIASYETLTDVLKTGDIWI